MSKKDRARFSRDDIDCKSGSERRKLSSSISTDIEKFLEAGGKITTLTTTDRTTENIEHDYFRKGDKKKNNNASTSGESCGEDLAFTKGGARSGDTGMPKVDATNDRKSFNHVRFSAKETSSDTEAGAGSEANA